MSDAAQINPPAPFSDQVDARGVPDAGTQCPTSEERMQLSMREMEGRLQASMQLMDERMQQMQSGLPAAMLQMEARIGASIQRMEERVVQGKQPPMGTTERSVQPGVLPPPPPQLLQQAQQGAASEACGTSVPKPTYLRSDQFGTDGDRDPRAVSFPRGSSSGPPPSASAEGGTGEGRGGGPVPVATLAPGIEAMGVVSGRAGGDAVHRTIVSLDFHVRFFLSAYVCAGVRFVFRCTRPPGAPSATEDRLETCALCRVGTCSTRTGEWMGGGRVACMPSRRVVWEGGCG
eukprot:GHVU01001391.1.p1 GENE.GHVU01001391.1~~GHVU01001391.1.p1  ORF type:complete len:289 (-),score=36.82 GHVU01001391.1:105-971(-)